MSHALSDDEADLIVTAIVLLAVIGPWFEKWSPKAAVYDPHQEQLIHLSPAIDGVLERWRASGLPQRLEAAT